MLQGTVVLTPKGSSKEYKMHVSGYDIARGINLVISPDDTETRNFLDTGEVSNLGVFPAQWHSLVMGIGEVSVSLGYDNEQPFRSQGINSDAFTVIGSVLREIKNACGNNNFVGADGESMGYKPKGAWGYADVALVANEYYSLQAKVEYKDWVVELSLHTSSLNFEKVYAPKNGYSWKLDLGWSEPIVNVEAYEALGISTDDDFYTLEQIQQRYPDRNYAWLTGCDYEIVTPENVAKVSEELLQAVEEGKKIAFDTETTGLNIRFTTDRGDGDYVVGFIFSIREGQGWFVPTRMNNITNIWQTSPDVKWSKGLEQEVVCKYFKEVLEKGLIIGHNVSFDWKAMWLYGINTNFVDDTLLVAHMGYCNEHRGVSESLKGLTAHFLGRNALELKDIAKSGDWSENNFADLPYETVRLYGCADGDDTLSLYNFFRREHHFEKYGLDKASYRIEVAFSCVAGYQEFYGHHVDMKRSDELKQAIENGMTASEAKMNAILGRPCNYKSSTQLQQALYVDLEYPILKRTAKGTPSTDKNTLKRLADATNADGTPKYPLAAELQIYRKWAQLKSNFTDVLDSLGTLDGFMFSEVNLPLETGRVSVRNPNYQSYNDTVKQYISPRHGYYMMDFDYSSVEYRILASLSGQRNLVETFKDPDTDYHTYQASRMFGVPYESVTSQLRHQAKGINFGLPYGMGDRSLGARIYGEATPENTAKARKLRALYFEGQENVEAFFDEKRESSWVNSYAETAFGRRRYFDKRKDREDSIRREGGNMAIQGTAADVFKLGMVNLFRSLTERGWLGKFLIPAFVHDEALYEVSNDIDPMDAMYLVEHSVFININANLPDWAPLYLGGGFGENWFHAKKTEIPIELQSTLMKKYSGKWNGTGPGLDWWDGNIERLYAWEVEQNSGYYAYRVKKYLSGKGLSGPDKPMDLEGQSVSPQVNSYALDMLKYLKGDGQKYEGASMRDWVDEAALEEWLNLGAPLGDNPVEQMDNAGWVLGLGRSKATEDDLRNPSAAKVSESTVDPGINIHDMDDVDLSESQESLAISMAKGMGAYLSDGKAYVWCPASSTREELMGRMNTLGTWENRVLRLFNLQNNKVFGSTDEVMTYPCVLILSSGDKVPMSVKVMGRVVRELQKAYRSEFME